MKPITIKAYAKINLILKVLNRRSDGYHNILTLMQNVDLADTLTFSTSDELTVESNLAIKPEDNLIYKAAKSLKAYAKINAGALINLEKIIPIEAGLGGGSSDAAATLNVLNKLWKTNLSSEQLKEIAATIGADVSFFIDGGSALVEGAGEKVHRLKPINNFDLVITKPTFGVSSKDAYEGLSLTRNIDLSAVDLLKNKIFTNRIEVSDYCNDLEKSVLDKYTKIQEYFKIGYDNKAERVMLSGSGSAFFALGQEKDLINIVKAWQNVETVKEGTVPEEGLSQQKLKVYKIKTINRSIDFES